MAKKYRIVTDMGVITLTGVSSVIISNDRPGLLSFYSDDDDVVGEVALRSLHYWYEEPTEDK